MSELPAGIEQAIGAYLMRGIFIDDSDGVEIEGDLQVLREPGNAAGLCCAVSSDFARFCRELGLEADVGPAPDQVYDEIHDTALISCEDKLYSVDWTAAQFEMREPFPYVLRFDAPRWRLLGDEA